MRLLGRGVSKFGISPKDLGLPFPKAKQIYIGKCILSVDPDNLLGFPSGPYDAHTHTCITSKHYKTICAPERFIKNSDGTPSDLIWHEYGHVLDIAYHMTYKQLLDGYQYSIEEWRKISHGPTFSIVMHRLGKPHLTGPYVNMPY